MHKKHMWIMLACCLIPIAGFALVSIYDLPLKSVFFFGMVILCPLSHLLMMKFMMRGEQHDHNSAPLRSPGHISEEASAESCH